MNEHDDIYMDIPFIRSLFPTSLVVPVSPRRTIPPTAPKNPQNNPTSDLKKCFLSQRGCDGSTAEEVLVEVLVEDLGGSRLR